MKTTTAIAILLLGVGANHAHAQYTVTVFGYQRGRHQPGHAHTWAVFTGPGERVCISWGPAGNFRLFSGAVQGHNKSEAETLLEAQQVGATVLAWGPYPIDTRTFARARAQAARLQSGAVLYRALDHKTRPWACNCIHAVSDVGGPLRTGTAYGFKASAMVAGHLLRR